MNERDQSKTPVTTSADAYRAIGMAVVSCQCFEFAFVACVRLVFAQGDEKLEDIEPLRKETFKIPTMNLLKELRKYVEISKHFEDFEGRVANVVERRHQLIHRWGMENGWPEDNDVEGLNRPGFPGGSIL